MPKVRTKQTSSRGFSLIELTVVVMVILVVAAIAIPNMMEARMKANEAAAVASIHAIDTAEAMYNISYPNVGYASSLPVLGRNGTNCSLPGKDNSCIIGDEALTDGLKDGYSFVITGDGNVPDASYTVTASPASGSSGRCYFSGDQSGLVRGVPVTSGGASRFVLGDGSGTGCGN
jgi:prepilin-type N-terminal cleavage/methylation domain-containing protein